LAGASFEIGAIDHERGRALRTEKLFYSLWQMHKEATSGKTHNTPLPNGVYVVLVAPL
jgi:hypothetical protein